MSSSLSIPPSSSAKKAITSLSDNILTLQQAVSKDVQIYVNEMSSFGYEENVQGAKKCSYLFHLKYVQNSRPCSLVVRLPWAIISKFEIPDSGKFTVKKANLFLNFKNHDFTDLVNNGEKYLQWLHLLIDNIKMAVDNYLGDQENVEKHLNTREGFLIQQLFNLNKKRDFINGFHYDENFEQDPLDIIQEHPTCFKIKPLLKFVDKNGKKSKFTEFFHSQKKKDDSGKYTPVDAIAEDLVEAVKNPELYTLGSAIITVENVCIMMHAKSGQYFAYIGLVVEQVHYCNTVFPKPQIVVHKEGSQEPYSTLEGVGSPLHQNFYNELGGPVLTTLPFKPLEEVVYSSAAAVSKEILKNKYVVKKKATAVVEKTADANNNNEEEENEDDENNTQMDN
jgi:hypothetical protein